MNQGNHDMSTRACIERAQSAATLTGLVETVRLLNERVSTNTTMIRLMEQLCAVQQEEIINLKETVRCLKRPS